MTTLLKEVLSLLSHPFPIWYGVVRKRDKIDQLANSIWRVFLRSKKLIFIKIHRRFVRMWVRISFRKENTHNYIFDVLFSQIKSASWKRRDRSRVVGQIFHVQIEEHIRVPAFNRAQLLFYFFGVQFQQTGNLNSLTDLKPEKIYLDGNLQRWAAMEVILCLLLRHRTGPRSSCKSSFQNILLLRTLPDLNWSQLVKRQLRMDR